jgi:tetratricopeptide (TPR) repeat protein
LMTEHERAVFRRLSVFRGGFTREAASALAGADLNVLASLAAKALIRRNGARYDLHELLRQYGSEQLEMAGEVLAMRERHLAYFVQFANEAEAALVGPLEVAIDQQLSEEMDNIREALSHALAHNVQAGLELSGALGHFWPRRNLKEGNDWLMRLLNQPAEATSDRARAKALLALALVHWPGTGAFERAVECAEAALEIYRSLGDESGAAWALSIAGWAHPDFRIGIARTTEALAMLRRLDDLFGQARALMRLGHLLTTSNLDQARECLTSSLALRRKLQWLSGTYGCLIALGRLALFHGEFDRAQTYVAEAVTMGHSFSAICDIVGALSLRAELGLRQGHYDQAEADFEACIAENLATGRVWTACWLQTHLGRVKLGQGELLRAHALLTATLRAFYKANTHSGICYACEGLAGLAVAQRAPARAVRLIAWADRARATIGDVRPPIEQQEVDGVLATARTQLDETAFAAAWTEGEAMTVDGVVEYALGQTTR